MQSYEVEVKSLLGSLENADAVRAKCKALDPTTTLVSKNKQLNHYFDGGSLETLASAIGSYLSSEARARLEDIVAQSKSFSVRTRDKDGTVFIVVKASVDDTTSSNGIARIELEEKVDLTLESLDAIVLGAGFNYQAKWSREREEYVVRGTNVTLDKNAGYGWLAEFEHIVDSSEKIAQARAEIDALMKDLGVSELPQDRLARMFDFYNTHWQEYYGTDKVFTIE